MNDNDLEKILMESKGINVKNHPMSDLQVGQGSPFIIVTKTVKKR